MISAKSNLNYVAGRRGIELEAEQRDVFTRSSAQDGGCDWWTTWVQEAPHALTDKLTIYDGENWENDKRISLTHYSQTLHVCYSRT